MKFFETEQEKELRLASRDWLADNVPKESRPHEGSAAREYDLAWQQRQFEGGWAGIQWPREFGGLGLTADLQLIWYEECVRAGAPGPGCLLGGLNHAGPILMQYGSDEQREKHLRPILEGREVWCQGFSEPGAGSDLASLRTRAIRDGDELVVTGQKVWTSYADLADYQELLVRTNDLGSKHKGISWVICDMRSPGIEVRPIRLMAGDNHFAEIFYDEVRIPIDRIVGGEDNGWRVAMATLSFERGTAFIADQMKLIGVVSELAEMSRTLPSPSGRGTCAEDGYVRTELGKLMASAEALGSMTLQMVSRNLHREQPGADASIVRLYYSSVAQRIHRLAQYMRGPDATVLDAPGDRAWTYDYLWSYQTSIGGGTREIQKNIVGDRHLGLPR